MESLIHVGCDVGQSHDPTALAVVEVRQISRGKQTFVAPAKTVRDARGMYIKHPARYEPVYETEYTLRHIQRLPLNTSYPTVAKQIVALLDSPELQDKERRIFVDSTGVGRPVVELISQEAQLRATTRDVLIKPVVFVHGETYNTSTGKVGKAYLVSRLQALLQNRLVLAPDTLEVRNLLDELKTYEIRVAENGKDVYGAFRSGSFDDLVTALALATLEDGFAHAIEPIDDDVADVLRDWRGW